jgi:hypothetical protein
LSTQQVLLALSSLCLVMGVVAVLSMRFDRELLGLATCAGLLVCLIAGRVFGYNELWRQLKRHVRRMGGAELRLSTRTAPEAPEVCRWRWRHGQPAPTLAAGWEVRCMVPLDGGGSVEILASGSRTEPPNATRLDELHKLFEAFCRKWQPAATPVESSDALPWIRQALPLPAALNTPPDHGDRRVA